MRTSFFPRETGFGRKVVNSVYELDLTTDCYMSLFSYDQLSQGSLDTMYLDIDGHDGSDPYPKFVAVKNALEDLRIPLSRAYFTGRGFAIYLDFEKPLNSMEYKKACQYVVTKLGVKHLLDPSVIGNLRGMGRVPSSFNTKGNRYMVQIDPSDSSENILNNSVNNIQTNNFGGYFDIQKFLNEMGFNYNNVSNKIITTNVKPVLNSYEYPPCINKAINDILKTGELDHVERIHLGSFLILNGEEQKLWDILRVANDFKESISANQIDSIKRHGGYSRACKNVPETICPYKDKRECLFNPNLFSIFGGKK